MGRKLAYSRPCVGASLLCSAKCAHCGLAHRLLTARRRARYAVEAAVAGLGGGMGGHFIPEFGRSAAA